MQYLNNIYPNLYHFLQDKGISADIVRDPGKLITCMWERGVQLKIMINCIVVVHHICGSRLIKWLLIPIYLFYDSQLHLLCYP